MLPMKGQYLVDAHGSPKAVLINFKEYQKMMKMIEDIRDVRFIHRHQHEKLVPMQDVHRRLKK